MMSNYRVEVINARTKKSYNLTIQAASAKAAKEEVQSYTNLARAKYRVGRVTNEVS